VTGLRQPHLQPVSWQRHAFFGHPQEHDRQSQVPQQFVVAIFFELVFFKLGIVFFLFLFSSASRAFKGADARPPKTLQSNGRHGRVT
jgi:hypothetical protein